MKTARDPRHLKRIEDFKALYTYSFAGVVDERIEDVIEKISEIDAQIHEAAPEREILQMDKTNVALLRLGVFELMTGTKPSVVIDEVVEIAKVYGSESSPKLVHAVLNVVAKKYGSNNTTT
ncbi:MAG TPA: transcription antitermination factor NusB [Patescibacteria group bacterium]|nr:transcription antitermination factor NusB [Patescibacteria group bacterium]